MKIVGPQLRHTVCLLVGLAVFFLVWHPSLAAKSPSSSIGQPEPSDAHFHLTNYIQKGPDIQAFLRIMGTRVGRVALFGIPLQEEWSYQNSGDVAPAYYLQTDAPLYYYSFTDAFIDTKMILTEDWGAP